LQRLGLLDIDDDVPLAAQLFDRVGGLRVVQRLAVPALFVGEERDAVAFLGFGDDDRGLVGLRGRFGERAVTGFQIVPVDLDDVAPEGAEPLGINGAVPAQIGLTALAQPVHVQNRDQVVELVVGGLVAGLPDGPLGHLAVAQNHPDFEGQLVHVLAAQGHADAVRQTLT